MKLTHTKTLLASLTASAMIAGSASAAPINFGTMNTTGDNLTGWTVAGTGGGGSTNTVNGPAEAGAKMFWMRSINTIMTGTSDGDVLAAGDYTVSFTFWEYSAPANNGTITVDVMAWDGTTETVLGTMNTIDTATSAAFDYTIPFTVATTDTDIIGDSIRLRFTGVATAPTNFVAFDNITGEFTAIPEPGSLALLGLGGLLIGARRRRD